MGTLLRITALGILVILANSLNKLRHELLTASTIALLIYQDSNMTPLVANFSHTFPDGQTVTLTVTQNAGESAAAFGVRARQEWEEFLAAWGG